MKTKSILATACACMATALVSCGDSSSDGMFGEIPQLYEDAQISMIKKAKSEFGDIKEIEKESDGLKLLSMMKEAMEKADEKAKPLAEAMKGKTIPYTVSDSLPFRIVSDITIQEVKLPSFNLIGNDDQTRIKTEFDIVLKDTIKGQYVSLYYFLSGNKGNITTGSESVSGGKKIHSEQIKTENSWWPQTIYYLVPGDTLHVEARIYAPDAPAKIAGQCKTLNFDTRYAVESQKKALREQLEKQNKELEKELGID